MLVKEIMSTNVIIANSGDLIGKVAELLHENKLKGVPVVNNYGIVEGLITETELFSGDHKLYLPMYGDLLKQTEFVVRSKDEGLPYEAGKITRITASEIMNRKVFFANPDMEVSELASKIANLKQNPIPVVDHANKLLGILSVGDVLRQLTGTPKNNLAKTGTEHFAEQEVKFVIDDMTTRFAFVSKTRAKFWLFAATILFIVGFMAGILYVVNPKLFIK